MLFHWEYNSRITVDKTKVTEIQLSCRNRQKKTLVTCQ